jgi:malic enzyme
MVAGFVHQAVDWRSLAAMMAGGVTYRLGRVGAMATGTGRLASLGIGLGAEVTAFEMTNRSLSSLTGDTYSNPNLWRWGGQGGIRQGLLSSLVTFGSLKGASRLAQGENVVVQHLLQNTGMVMGHHISGSFGITQRPTGSLAEQFLHAEATNLQMGAGMALAHHFSPEIHNLEQGLDLSLRAMAGGTTSSDSASPLDLLLGLAKPSLSTGHWQWGGFGPYRRSSSRGEPPFQRPSISLMSGTGNGCGQGVTTPERGNADPPEVLYPKEKAPATGSDSSAVTSDKPMQTSETGHPPGPDLSTARYHLPETEYFDGLKGSLSFDKLVGYARAVRRAQLVGPNLRNALLTPLSGPLEYSPYGAALVEHLREDPSRVHTLAGKWERALVASPGTAILGLGSASTDVDHILRAETADAIMQGKSKYFLWTAGVSATPLCIRSYLSADQARALEGMEPRHRAEQARIWRAERFAETVRALAPNFGFINIEDAQGKDLPLIFGILSSLRGDTAIWSDDMQGTGVITAAAMLSWAELTGRLDSRMQMPNIRGIIFGAGAGAMGVYNELINHGVRPENILVTDSKGVLHEDRYDTKSDPFKVRMREGIPAGVTVEDFARSSDFVINLGVKETFTDNLAWADQLARSLTPNPFVAPMTNPEPGISPEMLRRVRPDAYYGSGNQVYENPVNNFTAFGYIGAGAMMAKAGAVSPAMTVAAARGIFETAKLGPPEELRNKLPPEQREFGRSWLVPRPDDMRLIPAEAGAVAKAAARDGVAILLGANPSPTELTRFDREIDDQVSFRRWMVQSIRSQSEDGGPIFLAARHSRHYAPFALEREGEPVYHVAPEINRDHFEHFALQMGLTAPRWQHLLTLDGELKPTALTEMLEQLRPATEGVTPQARIAARELKLITQLAAISPSLGLALALRRSRIRDENLAARPTVFHREPVLRAVLQLIPEARAEIETSFEGIQEIL